MISIHGNRASLPYSVLSVSSLLSPLFSSSLLTSGSSSVCSFCFLLRFCFLFATSAINFFFSLSSAGFVGSSSSSSVSSSSSSSVLAFFFLPASGASCSTIFHDLLFLRSKHLIRNVFPMISSSSSSSDITRSRDLLGSKILSSPSTSIGKLITSYFSPAFGPLCAVFSTTVGSPTNVTIHLGVDSSNLIHLPCVSFFAFFLQFPMYFLPPLNDNC